MEAQTWFEMLWQEDAKKDPSHGGISKDRAWEVFFQSWQETDDIFRSAQNRNPKDAGDVSTPR